MSNFYSKWNDDTSSSKDCNDIFMAEVDQQDSVEDDLIVFTLKESIVVRSKWSVNVQHDMMKDFLLLSSLLDNIS